MLTCYLAPTHGLVGQRPADPELIGRLLDGHGQAVRGGRAPLSVTRLCLRAVSIAGRLAIRSDAAEIRPIVIAARWLTPTPAIEDWYHGDPLHVWPAAVDQFADVGFSQGLTQKDLLRPEGHARESSQAGLRRHPRRARCPERPGWRTI